MFLFSRISFIGMPSKPKSGLDLRKTTIAVHWFRHGLRLHDNPSLLDAINLGDELYPIFIFDGEVAGEYIVLCHKTGKEEIRYLS